MLEDDIGLEGIPNQMPLENIEEDKKLPDELILDKLKKAVEKVKFSYYSEAIKIYEEVIELLVNSNDIKDREKIACKTCLNLFQTLYFAGSLP